MLRKLVFISLCCLALFAASVKSTFAAPSDSAHFAQVLPGYHFSFPRDHGAHPRYQTEWWYYTGHLRAKNGRRFGYELTFFRYALTPKIPQGRSPWAARDVDFAHFAITDQSGKKYFFCDRMERANMGLAGTQKGQQKVLPKIWIDNWKLQFQGKNGARQIISAAGEAQNDPQKAPMKIRLSQRALTPPIINGVNEVSQKGPQKGQASHYYSFPRLATKGVLQLGKKRYEVSGQSWLDREFSSSSLSPKDTGWDWFAIQMDNGENIMLYQLRQKNGNISPFSAGTISSQKGKIAHLRGNNFTIKVTNWWRSPHTKRRYPAGWKITLANRKLSLIITPTVSDQELRPRHQSAIYWEGSCTVRGTKAGKAVRGKAYVELTGY